MKRFFFSAIALVALTISCTKSGLVEVPKTFETPISFEPYTGKAPTTKSTIMDDATLQEALYDAEDSPLTKGGFHVFAFTHTGSGETSTPNYSNVYMDEDVWCDEGPVADDPATTDVNESAPAHWDYNGVSYWPDGKLDFVAYGLNAQRHITLSNTKTTFTYNVPNLVSKQEDLIVAFSPNGENNGRAINLPFKHVLSKVGFSLETNNADPNVKVTIKKIVLTGAFKSQGTLNMASATPTFTNLSGDVTSYTFFGTEVTTTTDGVPTTSLVSYNPNAAGTYDCFVGDSNGKVLDDNGNQIYDPIYASHTIAVAGNSDDGFTQSNPAIKGTADEDNRYMMILPTDVQTNAKITVVYQLTGDEERTAEAQLANTFKFEAGKGYEFILKVSTLKVDFSVGVTDWDKGDYEDSYTLTPVTPAE